MKFKKIVAGLLTLSIILGSVSQINAEAPTAASEAAGMSLSNENMQISGANSFGNMVARELAAVSDEQEANNGCNVFSVEVSGTTASVSFETLYDSALVVAIYDNEGVQMITSGYKEVTAEEAEVEVEISGTIPQYFYIRAYLVNPDTLRPLSTEYGSPMYTREMQEFLSKTTADFDADRVLNLDDNPDTNFAVFSEDTTLIHEEGNYNVVVSADEATLTYVFENPDDNLLALDVGGVFAFEYNDELVILKAVSVEKSVDEGTGKVASVTVVGQEAELEEAFEHLRIDGEANSDKAVIDDSDMDEGVTCGGLVDDAEESGISPQAIDVTGKSSKSINFNIAEKKSGSFEFSSDLNVKLGTSAKVYLSFSEMYVEFKLDLTAKLSLEFEVSITAIKKEMRLAYIAIYICPGVYFSVTPEFVLELSGKASIEGTLSVTVGFKVSKNGIENLSSAPKFVAKGGIEVTIFIGFSLKPALSVVHEKVFNLSLDTKSGAEITAKVEASTEKDPTCIHECDICINGEIKGKFSIDITIKLLDTEKLKFKLSLLEVSVHIADFYISPTFDEFAFSKCPHYKYQTFLTVKNRDSDYISGATITIDKDKEYITNVKGEVEVWLTKGKHSTEIKATDYITKSSNLNIKEGGKHFKVTIEKGDDKSSEDLLSDILDKFKNGSSNPGDLDYGKAWDLRVKIVSLGYDMTPSGYSMAVTVDGSLYTWGKNDNGRLGNGTSKNSNIPIKIMDNIKSVNIYDGEANAAITKNGSLYTWGLYPGNGRYRSYVPVKIMDNVTSVDYKLYTYVAITTDGCLYTWGKNYSGILEEDSYVPVKIMDNVKSVESRGNYYAAITNDGSLYMWGDNKYGQLGNGTNENSNIPIKIMDKVKSVKITNNCCAAITDDGSLYMWGNNEYGQLGNGTKENSYVPIKIMDNVISVDCDGRFTGTITADGSLYMWGDSYVVPVKKMENVVSVKLMGSYYNIAALTADKTLYMWGVNYRNAGVNGVPKKILENVISTDFDTDTGAAVTADGNLYTWGQNSNGILGRETDYSYHYSYYTPVKILDNIKSVKIDYDHGAAIATDGSLYMWGDNKYGQLGNGTTENISVPVKVNFPIDGKASNSNSVNIPASYYSAFYNSVPSVITSLLPNEIYNIYSVNSRTVNKELASNNLLYIGQAVSDGSGNLTIPSAAQNGTVFVKAMHEFDVYNAPIIAAEVKGQAVSLEWEPLEGASEYEVYCYTTDGILSQTKTSATSLTIDNLEKGEYYGFLVTSIIHGEQSVPAIGDVRMVQIPKGILGDINNDTKVTIADARMLLQAASGSRELTEEQKAVADVNGDGKITIADARWLLQVASGSRALDD